MSSSSNNSSSSSSSRRRSSRRSNRRNNRNYKAGNRKRRSNSNNDDCRSCNIRSRRVRLVVIVGSWLLVVVNVVVSGRLWGYIVVNNNK